MRSKAIPLLLGLLFIPVLLYLALSYSCRRCPAVHGHVIDKVSGLPVGGLVIHKKGEGPALAFDANPTVEVAAASTSTDQLGAFSFRSHVSYSSIAKDLFWPGSVDTVRITVWGPEFIPVELKREFLSCKADILIRVRKPTCEEDWARKASITANMMSIDSAEQGRWLFHDLTEFYMRYPTSHHEFYFITSFMESYGPFLSLRRGGYGDIIFDCAKAKRASPSQIHDFAVRFYSIGNAAKFRATEMRENPMSFESVRKSSPSSPNCSEAYRKNYESAYESWLYTRKEIEKCLGRSLNDSLVNP